jgi:UDP-N-acetylmuramate dehydrogenase
MTPFQTACQHAFGQTGRLRLAEPLARHGTFAVGGPAEVWFAAANEGEISQIAALAHAQDLPILFAGNGTNVLYADAGARGAVVRVSPEAWSVAEDGATGEATLTAGAGVSLPKLVNDLAERGWAGLEWGAGVPGTIGGAVVSNAGCHGMCIGDTLLAARVLSLRDPAQATVAELPARELELGYRRSRFRQHREIAFTADHRPIAAPRLLVDPVEIILGATCRLTRDDPAAIKARVAHFKQHRKETQPPQPSAGSVFKNPPGDYAGRLIESLGLKGHQIGRAAISAKHANFIVNLGGATAADIISLIALAHASVQDRYAVTLELEVELRGDWEA